LEIWNVGLNSIEKKNRGTSSIQLNILILQLTVNRYSLATQLQNRFLESIPRPIAGLKFSSLDPHNLKPFTDRMLGIL
jgi:hypothetical protein